MSQRALMSGGLARPASGTSDDVRERWGGHARLPGRITDLEQVARRVEEVKLAAGEEAVLAVSELFDLHPSLVEEPDRLLPFLRREGEGVMQAVVLLRGPVELLLALAKQDIVVAHVEARHVGVAQPPAIFETEQVAVEALALLQIVDRDGPVGDAVDLEHILTSARVSGATRLYCAGCTWGRAVCLSTSLGVILRRGSKNIVEARRDSLTVITS